VGITRAKTNLHILYYHNDTVIARFAKETFLSSRWTISSYTNRARSMMPKRKRTVRTLHE
ncbi:MAG TPA: hypothetical protein VF857_03950, partial [Spirochaetota bacterium]